MNIDSKDKFVDPLARDNKIAFVCDGSLGAGQIANRAAVLATGLAAKFPEIVGPDIQTVDQVDISGITKVPISMLTINGTASVSGLYQKANEFDCEVFIYLSRAQGLRSYEEYTKSITSQTNKFNDIDAILIYGPKKTINRITGSLPLLR